MPTAHLICGLPGSGKTTYARRLRAGGDRILLSLDPWLIRLFGRYSLDDVGQEEHTRRVLACRELIWEVADDFLRRGVDVVFDDGFFLREHRARRVAASLAAGAATTIHFLDTPLDVIRMRLEQRNATLPAYNFRIDPAMLEAFVGMFERPSAAEGAEVITVHPDGGAGDAAGRDSAHPAIH